VRKACLTGVLILLVLAGVTSCGGEIPLPEPAPLRAQRETDDWVKPGKMVQLRRITFVFRQERMRIQNGEAFDVTPLDDIWLRLSAPNAAVRRGGPYIGDRRRGWYVYLRCPVPHSIPVGQEIEIPYDACAATTYEPGPGASLIGVRLTAREGYFEEALEGTGEFVGRR
jgi:hypothetical protein